MADGGALLQGKYKFTADELSEIVKERDSKKIEEWGGVEGIATGLETDLQNGLSTWEADQGFPHRSARYGRNEYPVKPPKSIYELIWDALGDRTLQILIGAAIVSIILGVAFGHGGGAQGPTGSASGSSSWNGEVGSTSGGTFDETGTSSGSIDNSGTSGDYVDEGSTGGSITGAAAGYSLLSDEPAGEGGEAPGWIEGVAILVAVTLVVGVTSFNDYNKEKQFRQLTAQNEDQMIKVKRGGRETTVNIKDIQVGEIVLLESGDTIPADGIFISGFTMTADDSPMTGEPDPVPKDEAHPFLLSNCRIMEGRGSMIVVAVGIHSEWGKIKVGLDTEHEDTPLQEKLETLAENIGKMGLVAAIFTLIALIINRIVVIQRDPSLNWSWDELSNLVDYMIIAVTIIVVAVPEGLPLAVTISLAYSMRKMMADNNLVRHLAACETMGGATNICSDKTGTLTQNRMTVVQGWISGREFKDDQVPMLAEDVKFLFNENVAVNSSAYIEVKNGVEDFIGSKTEGAMLQWAAQKLGDNWEERRKQAKILKVFPFSSKTKQMSTVVKAGEDRVRLHKKGAPEAVITNCSHVLDPNGQTIPFTDQSRAELLRKTEEFASSGLRTIGLAYAEYLAPANFKEAPSEGLICIGIIGIKDPVRKEVPAAVAVCRGAGITVRMVTGDNILTAEHIAKECNILSEDGICIEGPRFRKLSTKELDNMLPRLQVLARASPDDKLQLVKRLKALGEVVASTGDGTNDALQLKEADVGFAMGITGTSVAKEASDIILMDDNFASIAKACMWGRNVYDSIRKFLQFQLTVNIGAVVVAFIGAVVPGIGESPLSAVQMLWVNLIMDTFAALALATEPPSPKLLERPPYGRFDSLVTNAMWRMIISMTIYQLVVLFVLLFGVQHLEWAFGPVNVDEPEGRLLRGTIIFHTFVLCQLANEINCRKLGNELNVFAGFFNNYLFIGIIIGSLIVQTLMVQVSTPNTVIPSAGLTGQQWLACAIIALISIPYAFLVKLLIPVPPDRVNVREEETPLLPSTRELSIYESKWTLVKKVVAKIKVINALRHYRRHRR
eukprot:TRINITY_DN7650_c0_g2_i1.p1 TRINITY_DN7650_c0_g2~~TRINITY_DN7650_c0_g2_i1.p1  ORF type:complete len:1066 (+),score=297.26 TRINITY_DN7650_c0_g2_i1:223-3420(+)